MDLYESMNSQKEPKQKKKDWQIIFLLNVSY